MVMVMAFNSCDPEELDTPPAPGIGSLKINFIHHVDGIDVELDKQEYENAAGDNYGITKLQYFLSNFEFGSSNDKNHKPEDSYHLISIVNQPSLGGFYKKTSVQYDLPSREYQQLIFHVGIDSERNTSGPYNGDLEFSWNMNWSWSGDYIFFKHEGTFQKEDGSEKYIYHLAGDENYKEVVIDLPDGLTIDDNGVHELNVFVNMNEFFTNPNTIDLNTQNTTMSPGSDLAIILAENYAGLFSLEK